MNLLRKTFAIVTSLTMVAMFMAPAFSVKAEEDTTIAELQALIASLNETIITLTNQLAAALGGETTPPPATGGAITGVPEDFTFTTNLSLGDSGNAVNYLQIVLNSDVETQLAVSGVGSPGNETSYFGPLTKTGVITFQEKYSADVLAVYNLTAGTGFVGTTTRAKLNELLAVSDDGDDGDDGDTPPVVLGITSVSPESDAVDVAIDSDIEAIFNMPLDEATMTDESFTVTDADEEEVAGTITYASDTYEISFDPTEDLANDTLYTVVITVDILSTDGEAMEEGADWSFTTIEAEFTGLGISLSDNTPDSRGIAFNESGVIYTTLTATASEEDVEITGLTIDRVGLGRYNDFSRIYVVVDGVRHGSKRVLGSDNTVDLSFSGTYSKITILDGETKEIEIVADMDAISGGTPLSGDMNALMVSAIETSSVIEGDLPFTGNALTVTSIAAPTADFSYEGDDSDVTVGETQVTVGEFTLENSSDAETISFVSLNLKQAGSVDNDEVINYTLYDADTDEAIAPVVDASDSDQIIFILDEVMEIEDGKDVDLEVKADIEDGEGQVIALVLDETTDLVATGADHGFTVLVTLNGNNDIHLLVGGVLTVNENDDNPNAQVIAPNTDNVTFLAADFEVEEGTVLITSLQLDITHTGTSNDAADLDNITLYRDGTKVAGALDYDATAVANGYVVFDEDFEINDSQVITVEIDITDDADAADVYTVEIDSANLTAERLDGTDVDPADINGTATGKTVTVSTGDLTLAKTSGYGDQDVVAGSDDVKIGSFVLQAGSAEDIKIKKYTVDFTLNGLLVGDISNLKIGSKTISTPDLLNNIFTINETLAADNTTTVNVYADIDSDLDAGDTIRINLEVDLEGVSSQIDDDVNTDGQLITVAVSSLSAALSSATPSSDIILALNDDVEMGRYTFSAVSEDFVISEIKVTAAAGTARDFEEVYLGYGDDETTGTAILVNSVAHFTGLAIEIPADDKDDVIVYGNLNKIASGYAVSGDQPTFQLTYYKAESDTQEVEEASVAGTATPAVKATGTTTVPGAFGTVDLALDVGEVPEVSTITFVSDDSDSLDGKYFTVVGQGAPDVVYGFWFDVGDTGTVDPTPAGITGVEITTVSTDDDAQTVAGLVATVINAQGAFAAAALANTHAVKVTNAVDGAVVDAADVDAGVAVTVAVQGADAISVTLDYAATKAEIATAVANNMTSVTTGTTGDDLNLTAKASGTAGNYTLAIGDNAYYSGKTLPALTLTSGVDAEFQLDTITPTVTTVGGGGAADAVYTLRITMDSGGMANFTVNEVTYDTLKKVIDQFVSIINASSLVEVTAWNDSDTTLKVEANVIGTIGGFTSSDLSNGNSDPADILAIAPTNAAVNAVVATGDITIADVVTDDLDLTLDVDGAAVTLAYGDTAANIATKIAAVITSAVAVGNGADIELTALTAGTAGNETLTVANATYYNAQTLPALTLAGGAAEVPGGDITSEVMTLRKAKPIIEFVDVSDKLLSDATRKLYEFKVSSSDGATEFGFTSIQLYVTGSFTGGAQLTIDDAKIYSSVGSTLLDAANNASVTAAGALVFDGLDETISSTEKTYYVKGTISNVDTDDTLTTRFYYDEASDNGFIWTDDDTVNADATHLDLPEDNVTLRESTS